MCSKEVAGTTGLTRFYASPVRTQTELHLCFLFGTP